MSKAATKSYDTPSGLPPIPRTPTGINPENGQQMYNYDLSALDEWAAENGYSKDNPIPMAATGPYSAGIVKLSDGTLYDVTDHFIVTHSQAHSDEIHHAIAMQHERSGRYDSPEQGTKLRHTDCAFCDAPATEHLQDPRLRTAVASGYDTVLQPLPLQQAIDAHLASIAADGSEV